MKRLILRVAAEQDFDAATLWYNDQEGDLGEAFVAEVQQAFDVILQHPERFPIVHRDIREMALKRFPHVIHYQVRSDRVIVLSVFHPARDPSIWQSRA